VSIGENVVIHTAGSLPTGQPAVVDIGKKTLNEHNYFSLLNYLGSYSIPHMNNVKIDGILNTFY